MPDRSSFRCVHLSAQHFSDDVRILVKECESLVKAGFEVHLIAQSSRTGKRVEELSDDVQVHFLESPSGGGANIVRRMREVRRRALALDAVLYHFHDPELLPLGIELKARGKRVVYDVHEDYRRQFLTKRWMKLWKRWVAVIWIAGFETIARRILDAFVVTTPHIAQIYPANRTKVVSNFPMMQEFSAPGKQPHNQRRSQVVYLGGMSIERGIREMIEAVELVAESRDVALVLAGRAINEDTEKVLDQGRQSAWVQDRGWLDRSEVVKTLNASRAGLVVPRPEEPFMSNYLVKMFEYMAAGLPVIAADFPLWRRIIRGTHSGLLVDPMDPESIASAIDWVLDHPDEAQEMGKKGRRAVEKRYNWECEAKKLVVLYSELLV